MQPRTSLSNVADAYMHHQAPVVSSALVHPELGRESNDGVLLPFICVLGLTLELLGVRDLQKKMCFTSSKRNPAGMNTA